MRHAHLLVLPAVLLVAACQPQSPAPAQDSAADTAPPAATAPPPAVDATGQGTQPGDAAMPQGMGGVPATVAATAELKPTQGNTTAGTLRFAPVDGGIRVTGQVTGLTPGEHGFHVHEKGDCSAPDASSAGGHFNPGGNAHGRVGQGEHHGGDSDNITANADGVAEVDTLLEGVTLGDATGTDIIEKAVIVHVDADDYVTQPTGNAGGRLACGVISAAP